MFNKYKIIEVSGKGEGIFSHYYIIKRKVLFWWMNVRIKSICHIEDYNYCVQKEIIKCLNINFAKEIINDYLNSKKYILYRGVKIYKCISYNLDCVFPFCKIIYYTNDYLDNIDNWEINNLGSLENVKRYIDKQKLTKKEQLNKTIYI